MSLKQNVTSLAITASRLPLIVDVVHHPLLLRTLGKLPGFRNYYGRGFFLPHPFDRRYGTDTSGYVPPEELPVIPYSSTGTQPYGGSQSSIIRTALKALPAL